MKITVKDVGVLEKWVRGFADGHFECLILVSWPGTGKTTILEKAVKDNARILKGGQLTAFQFYKELYQNRDRLIVLDDIDRLYRDRETVNLLKCVANTDPVKVVGWHSSTHKLSQANIPREFETTSKVAITANDWKTLNKNLDAVENRGIVISYEPTALQIHAEAVEWFQDKEVFRFVGKNLYLIKEPSFRHYITAAQAKAAGLDWRAAFLESLDLKPQEVLVANLKADPSYQTEEDRVKAFVAGSGMHRATYFRVASRLEAMRLCD